MSTGPALVASQAVGGRERGQSGGRSRGRGGGGGGGGGRGRGREDGQDTEQQQHEYQPYLYDTSSQPAAPKFSRYRSLRGKSVSTIPNTVTVTASSSISGSDNSSRRSSSNAEMMHNQNPHQPSRSGQLQEAASGNSIARSMSRYRRRANSVSVNRDVTPKIDSDPPHPCYHEPSVPPVPAIPCLPLNTASASPAEKEIQGHDADDAYGFPPLDRPPPPPPSLPPPLPAAAAAIATTTAAPAPAPASRHQVRHSDTTTRPHHRRNMESHWGRPSTASDESRGRRRTDREEQRRKPGSQEQAARHAEEAARLEAERDRIIKEQKRNDLRRLEAELANTQKAVFHAPKPRSPVLEKFAMLTKSRKSKDTLSPGLSSTSSAAGSVVDFGRTLSHEPPRPVPAHIEPGGRGIVPQTDAPSSAINAGDRTVAVRCRHHTFDLEVTPETTPVDILFQISNQMSYDLEISPANCVVVEMYGMLGLERRLRRYERIRDVMNTWDGDTQNQLVVTVSDSEDQDYDLEVDSVPKTRDPPQGCQVYMYHSNRPGKWNKRWITLLDNGQILCAKKPASTLADKDTSSLCRLSDYDIYTPTESHMRRHIKPPKRFCFAVKSQEKTTVFMNTDNYVQYFSTEDPTVAAQFRERVHGWRSWYLVDRRPEVKKPRQPKTSIPKVDEKPPQITASKHAPKKSVNVAALDGHRLRVSIDESPYAIGQFEPLLDMKRFDKRLSQFGKDFLPPPPIPDISTMPKSAPAGKADMRLVDSIPTVGGDGFTGGLLGRGYDERKQAAQAEMERLGARRRPSTKDEAFTEGPSLLNRPAAEPPSPAHKPESPSWFPSALEHSAKQRVTTTTRPSTSAGVMTSHSHTRRSSMTRATSAHPPPPPLPLNLKPITNTTTTATATTTTTGAKPPSSSSSSTSPSSKRPHHPPSTIHPNPLASQPTGISHSNRRERPKPLVNLSSPTTPTIQEPPQWNKEGTGHGVKGTEGLHHLIDLITVADPTTSTAKKGVTTAGGGGGGTLLAVPPRSTLRSRPSGGGSGIGGSSGGGGGTLSRTRSKSSSGAAVSSRGIGTEGPPPVPLLPRLGGENVAGLGLRLRMKDTRAEEDDKDREVREMKERVLRERERVRVREKERERERGRERERDMNSRRGGGGGGGATATTVSSGRTGTLKVV
ncbi:hypothetical protein F4778DRAFT_779873 [Xylariomycetidae sp. FL2044]|nr:hypothetical protein F4778DRAFT_779873 [Xylariomycetidae sp. FL2044]